MNSAEKLQLLQEWDAYTSKVTEQLDGFLALTGAMPDCALLAPVYDLKEAYTREISRRLNDGAEWLQYFECDCERGKAPKEVTWTSSDGRSVSVTICSLETLLQVLEG